MDAYTRRCLEVEAYGELGMWEEAQSALEEFFEGVTEHPEILGHLAMLGVAMDFSSTKGLPAFFSPSPAYLKSTWGQGELARL